MGPIPFAFSVSHFINSVGADAGFASIIGLAVLVLLYFAHARETSSLREQAYESAQRVQQLETRITQLARQPAPAQPTSAPVSAHAQPLTRPVPAAVPVAPGSHAPVPAMAAAPAAPAGVGAPALTAATRLIPDRAPAMAQAAPGPAAPVVPEEVSREPAGPGPATAAGAANGTAQAPSAPAAQFSGDAQPPPSRSQIRVAAAAPGRRPVAAQRASARSGSSTGRRVLAAVLVVLSIAGVVVALLVVTSSGGGSSASSTNSSAASNAPTTTSQRRKPPAAVTPSSVTVAVLNGTATSGLAHRVGVKLAASGYKQGTVATATDQTRTATVVAFMPGHRRDAVSVATALKLGSASVQPLDQNTQAVACPPPGACTSGVVVTVGSDLANIQ